jgi:dihydrofolate reductase
VKTQYYTASSLDGFIATLDDSLEWLFPLGDIESTSYPAFIQNVGALTMGSATYEWMLRNVVGPTAKRPQPWPYHQPTWVFTSRTLPALPDVDIRFVRGDVRPVHGQMVKAAGGRNVWIVGGGELAGRFHDYVSPSCRGPSRIRRFVSSQQEQLGPGSRSCTTRFLEGRQRPISSSSG